MILAVRIAEIFRSIQGEGLYAGTPSVFVRTTGCNLRCWFCDTPYTSIRPEGNHHSWQDILRDVLKHEVRHVVLTGGEPLLQPNLARLAEGLRKQDRVVTIETAATIFREVEADLISISPKLANSTPREESRWKQRHERDRDRPDVVQKLMARSDYQLKFVVDHRDDLIEIQKYLQQFPDIRPEKVWLMPQGITRSDLQAKAEWLAPAATELRFQYCPRKHIELFGSVRGT